MTMSTPPANPPIPPQVRRAAAELLIGAVTGNDHRYLAALQQLLGPSLDPLQVLEQADAVISLATLARVVIVTLADRLTGDPARARLVAADLVATASESAIAYDRARRAGPRAWPGEDRRP
jgi:hypothetical protein